MRGLDIFILCQRHVIYSSWQNGAVGMISIGLRLNLI
jgi:hypothetical protein